MQEKHFESRSGLCAAPSFQLTSTTGFNQTCHNVMPDEQRDGCCYRYRDTGAAAASSSWRQAVEQVLGSDEQRTLTTRDLKLMSHDWCKL